MYSPRRSAIRLLALAGLGLLAVASPGVAAVLPDDRLVLVMDGGAEGLQIDGHSVGVTFPSATTGLVAGNVAIKQPLVLSKRAGGAASNRLLGALLKAPSLPSLRVFWLTATERLASSIPPDIGATTVRLTSYTLDGVEADPTSKSLRVIERFALDYQELSLGKKAGTGLTSLVAPGVLTNIFLESAAFPDPVFFSAFSFTFDRTGIDGTVLRPQPLQLTRKTDAMSAVFLDHANQRKPIPLVTLVSQSPDLKDRTFEWRLSNVTVTQYRQVTSGTSNPVDTIALVFDKIEIVPMAAGKAVDPITIVFKP